jgi:hypothetical protein
MKRNRITISLALICLVTNVCFSQWTISGTNVIFNRLGKVGIGTSTPDGKLDVRAFAGRGIYAESSGTNPSESALYARGKKTGPGVYSEGWEGYGSYNFSWYNNGVVGNIVDRGNNYAGYFSGPVFSTSSFVTSDRKLKSNIEPIENALGEISLLKPKSYTFNTEKYPHMNLPTGQHMGLMAEELEKIYPDLVRENNSIITEENPEQINFKVVNYLELIPLLVKGIQEQQSTIEGLQNKVDHLEKLLTGGNAGNTSKYKLMPNPANSETVIHDLEGIGFERSTVVIIGVNGQILDRIQNGSSNAYLTLKTSSYPSGVYYLNILKGGKQDSVPMIIQK